MTTLKPYPAYKDSGIPWLGETPAHWRGQRLKSVVTVAREIVLAADHPLPYVGMEHIRSWSGRRYGSIASTAVNGQAIKFQAGQILFGKLRPYLAKVYRSDMEGLASTEFLVLDSNEQYHSYVFWLLISKDFIDLVDSSTFGARMPRADWAFVGDQVVPLPPLDGI